MIQKLIRKVYSFSSQQKSIVQVFKERNLFYQSNSPMLMEAEFVATNKGKSVYCGYDPTASSLHIGNLISILMLARLSMMGFKPIFLVGGATGLIGDPSGKSSQRQLLEEKIVEENIASIQKEIQKIFGNIQEKIKSSHEKLGINEEEVNNLIQSKHEIVNNFHFYQKVNLIEFLRDVGKNFRMSPLLARDMVSRRLQSQDGLSFAEFAYSLMQGYDFCQLFEKSNCVLQIGGSDQWGNILNGADLVKKKHNKQVYALTMPLLLTKSGVKFGKSEGNALFLNEQKTPLKDTYQYFYNTADEDLQKYLKIFTFFSSQKVSEIINKHNESKEKRFGQEILSEQIVCIIGRYCHIDKQFFTLSHSQLVSKPEAYFQSLFKEKRHSDSNRVKVVEKDNLLSNMKQWAQVLFLMGLTKGKKQGRRQIEAGGIYVNNQKVVASQNSGNFTLKLKSQFIFGKYLILRSGKKTMPSFNWFEINSGRSFIRSLHQELSETMKLLVILSKQTFKENWFQKIILFYLSVIYYPFIIHQTLIKQILKTVNQYKSGFNSFKLLYNLL